MDEAVVLPSATALRVRCECCDVHVGCGASVTLFE